VEKENGAWENDLYAEKEIYVEEKGIVFLEKEIDV